MKSSLRLLLFAIGFLLGASVAHAETIATLKPVAEVEGTNVRLSDVFDGVPRDIDRMIATAPAPGKSVTYDTRVLMRLSEQYRLGWQPQGSTDRIVVKRLSNHISKDAIRDAVLAKLSEAPFSTQVRGKADIAFDNRSPELDLPVDQAPDFKLINFDYTQQDKKFHADLVTTSGPNATTLPLSGRVMIKRDVATFAHKIESGTVIAPEDLDWIQMPDEKVTPDMITESSQAVGRELRRDGAEGVLVRTRDLSAPRLVMRGGLVTLKVETPMFLITAQGRSLQDGAMGDVVRVTNTQSNRIVEGTVIAPGIVRVATTLQTLSPKSAM